MGKLKVKNSPAKAAGFEAIKKENTPISKQKVNLVKEEKKLALAVKTSIKKENVTPASTPSKKTPTKKRKLEESPACEELSKKPKDAEPVAQSPKKKLNSQSPKVHTTKKLNGQSPKVHTPKQKTPKKETQTPKVSEDKQPAIKNKKNKKQRKNANAPQEILEVVDKEELLKLEDDRKHQQDLRTLYIRFRKKNSMKTEANVYDVHPQIKHVRVFRGSKFRSRNEGSIQFAFIEFESEKEAKKAHKDLSPKSDDYFVDFLGPDSKTKSLKGASKDSKKDKKKNKKVNPAKINPLRLFVNGVNPSVTLPILRELFPKSAKVFIPKISKEKRSRYAFVEFKTPQEARGAFDASKNLELNGHHITVLYARYEKTNNRKEEDVDTDVKKEDAVKVKKTKTKNAKEDIEEENEDMDLGAEEESDDEEEGSDVENDEDEEGSDVENDEEGDESEDE